MITLGIILLLIGFIAKIGVLWSTDHPLACWPGPRRAWIHGTRRWCAAPQLLKSYPRDLGPSFVNSGLG
jgi:hypothetical protein